MQGHPTINQPPPTPIDGNRLTRYAYYRGRVAMHALLKALGVGPGDEVVVQAFTCVAVPEGVLACGATPVYADIEADGYNASVTQIAARITDRTRAIIVQHTFGLPADVRGIVSLGDRHGVPVVEDCCHTLRGTVGGRPLGSFGSGAFYSFEWGKPLVAGVGGSAVASHAPLAKRLAEGESQYTEPTLARTLRIELQYRAFQALYRPRWYWGIRSAFRSLSRAGAAEGNFNAYHPDEAAPDFTLRMADHLRRRARRKARRLDRDALGRTAVELRYREALDPISMALPNTPADAYAPLARLPLRVANKAELLGRAARAGVELADWYTTAIHPLVGEDLRVVGYQPGSCPHAERRAAEVVSLPTHAGVDRRFIATAARLLNTAAVPIGPGLQQLEAA